MDFISRLEKLEKITKRFNLTEDEKETVEVAAKGLHFIEQLFLKPWFVVFLEELDKDLTPEQQEFMNLIMKKERTNEEEIVIRETNERELNETKDYKNSINTIFKKRFEQKI